MASGKLEYFSENCTFAYKGNQFNAILIATIVISFPEKLRHDYS